MAEIRQFAAIFGVFPRFSEFYREKKRPRHAKSVLGASGRASHHAKSDTWKERLFGNNYVAQKVMGRSIGRSLKKLRYQHKHMSIMQCTRHPPALSTTLPVLSAAKREISSPPQQTYFKTTLTSRRCSNNCSNRKFPDVNSLQQILCYLNQGPHTVELL